MVMYLIHLNDIDKFQYSPDDVETNLPNIGQLLRRQSEGQIVKDLASAKMQKVGMILCNMLSILIPMTFFVVTSA